VHGRCDSNDDVIIILSFTYDIRSFRKHGIEGGSHLATILAIFSKGKTSSLDPPKSGLGSVGVVYLGSNYHVGGFVKHTCMFRKPPQLETCMFDLLVFVIICQRLYIYIYMEIICFFQLNSLQEIWQSLATIKSHR